MEKKYINKVPNDLIDGALFIIYDYCEYMASATNVEEIDYV